MEYPWNIEKKIVEYNCPICNKRKLHRKIKSYKYGNNCNGWDDFVLFYNHYFCDECDEFTLKISKEDWY